MTCHPACKSHFWLHTWTLIALIFSLFGPLLAGCINSTQPPTSTLPIKVIVDAQILEQDVPAGSTVQRALETVGVVLGNLDQVDPPGFTSITETLTITVTRIREEFEIEESTIPFTQQKVRNESLPDGQTLLIQSGVNGTEQTTYRLVFENNQQVSRTAVKTSTLVEPLPEIIMVGIKAPFTAQPIPGKLIYIIAGNAWMMENTTAERTPLVTTGDLDGRILRLSDNGKWLLYTRTSGKDPAVEINTLWAANISVDPIRTYNLQARNVISFADWMPDQAQAVLYSTVEPRSAAPGWQANNDLDRVVFTTAGNLSPVEEILAPNSGGLYGWWGTHFEFSPDHESLLYARPDSIGLVDMEKGELTPLLGITPYQTRSNWAWVPGVAWSPDSKWLYTVTHSLENGITDPESSELFNLTAVNLNSSNLVDLVQETGMFTYPACSSQDEEDRFSVAFLRAVFPRQSADSRYRLWIMEQDGSNQREIFPPTDSPGLDAQQVLWSPPSDAGSSILAVIYQGNLYLINSTNGDSSQITGDGLLTQIYWK
jgi:hypothetical protein